MLHLKSLNMENRKYVIFNVNELDKINFNEVQETSIDTVRRSKDKTLTFVKYDVDVMPASVTTLVSKQGPYSFDEIREILSADEWQPIIENKI
jgi:hypothetical protein